MLISSARRARERGGRGSDQGGVPGRRLRHGLIWTGLLVALAAGIVTSLPNLHAVRARLDAVAPGWVGVAVALEFLSCMSYVYVFRWVFPRVPAKLASRTAWAEMAFGAVVPLGGAGGMAVGAWILHAKGAPLRLVARRSAVLFLLTSAVNAAVLCLGGLGLGTGLLPGRHGAVAGLGSAVFAAVAVVLFLAVAHRMPPHASAAGRVGLWAQRTRLVVLDSLELVRSGDWRLAAAAGYLLFDVAVLWACFRAFGDSISLGALVVGYQIGYLANLIPIPGGIGVLDGGLVGALMFCGAPARQTLAAVLVYHLIALWLPTGGGTLAFLSLRQGLAPRLSLEANPDCGLSPSGPRNRCSNDGGRAPGRRGSYHLPGAGRRSSRAEPRQPAEADPPGQSTPRPR